MKIRDFTEDEFDLLRDNAARKAGISRGDLEDLIFNSKQLAAIKSAPLIYESMPAKQPRESAIVREPHEQDARDQIREYQKSGYELVSVSSTPNSWLLLHFRKP